MTEIGMRRYTSVAVTPILIEIVYLSILCVVAVVLAHPIPGLRLTFAHYLIFMVGGALGMLWSVDAFLWITQIVFKALGMEFRREWDFVLYIVGAVGAVAGGVGLLWVKVRLLGGASGD
jgi:hypothetical protein